MELKIVQIGNSKGIVLPKQLIEQYGLADKVDLDLAPDHLILRPNKKIRDGWDQAFEGFGESEEEKALVLDLPENPEGLEWTW